MNTDPEAEVTTGAVQAITKPRKPQPMKEMKRRAKVLIAQAKQLEEGERRCRAVKKSGERCKRYAIRGGRVCPYHGGSAPQVRAKANRRLLAMVEPSIIRLEALIHQDEHMPTALGAIRTVLERAGAEAIGPLAKDVERDNRPIINVGIKVGGIDVPPTITVATLTPTPVIEDSQE